MGGVLLTVSHTLHSTYKNEDNTAANHQSEAWYVASTTHTNYYVQESAPFGRRPLRRRVRAELRDSVN